MIVVIDESDIASDRKIRKRVAASSRKLAREQKRGMKGGGGGKRRKGNLVFLLSVPS